MGEDIIIPDDMFESPDEAKRRMIYCKYVGETKYGILIDIQFRKPIWAETLQKSWKITKFIDFAAIHAGLVQIRRAKDGSVFMPNPLFDTSAIEERKKGQWEL